MDGLKGLRREVLKNPLASSILRLPRPKTPNEPITIGAGSLRFQVRVLGKNILLQRQGGRIHAFDDRCTVGRENAPGNHYSVSDDLLSRVHFTLALWNDYLEVIDHHSKNGTVVEWHDRLGKLSARYRENDPDLKLIIDRNQVVLESVWEERSFIDLVALGVTVGGGFVKTHDERPSYFVTIEKHEGRLRIISASDDLSDHLLSVALRSIDQFNRDRIN
ncbi:FHA domain-containing protein [Candidatus Saganbacteria bacterium]|nr:FHA domain-containing protein [Candidatus Saganbacteria bacterium]